MFSRHRARLRRVLAWPPLVLSASLALSGAAARAQPASPPPTLKQVFEQTWSAQPEALAAPSRREAAWARQAQAGRWAAEAPSVALSSKSDRWGRNTGAREHEVGVAWPLWLPGERSRSQAVAGAERGAVDSRLAAARWRWAGTVREAWWALGQAQQDHALALARQAGAQRLAQDVARRVKAGDLSRADGHQASAALALAVAEAAHAEAGVAAARQTLLAWGAAVPETAPAPAACEVPEAEPAGVAQEPAADHPALAEWSDRATVAARARDLAATQKRAHPELTVATSRERGAVGEAYGQTVTLGLRIPLGAGGAYEAKLADASAEEIEAQQQVALARQRLRADLAAAQARLVAARRGAEAASQRVGLAHETLGFVEKSFRLGESDLPTRLRVEMEAFEAERQRARACLAVNQAVSALRQALGLLPE